MSNFSKRLTNLERRRGEMSVLVLYFDGGRVTDDNTEHPELIGKTEAEIDSMFAGRSDIQLIMIVYV
jgi:hypothetical protein